MVEVIELSGGASRNKPYSVEGNERTDAKDMRQRMINDCMPLTYVM